MARAYPTPDFQKYDFMRIKGLARARYGRVSYAVILCCCVMVLISNILHNWIIYSQFPCIFPNSGPPDLINLRSGGG